MKYAAGREKGGAVAFTAARPLWGAKPTHEASAKPNLFELCLARRRKTIVKALWRDSDTVPAAGIDD